MGREYFYVWGTDGKDKLKVNNKSFGKVYSKGGNDTITIGKNGYSTVIHCGKGNDTVYLYTGKARDYWDWGNEVFLDSGNNTVKIDTKIENKIYGGSGKDTVYVKSNGNMIWTNKGNDKIILSNCKNNIVKAGSGNDIIQATNYSVPDLMNKYTTYTIGYSTKVREDYYGLYGGAGKDEISVKNGKNVIADGGAGDDIIHLAGDNLSYGQFSCGTGNDVITVVGSKKKNTVEGGKGNDSFYVRGKNVKQITLAGGSGNNTFWIDVTKLGSNATIHISSNYSKDTLVVYTGNRNYKDIKLSDTMFDYSNSYAVKYGDKIIYADVKKVYFQDRNQAIRNKATILDFKKSVDEIYATFGFDTTIGSIGEDAMLPREVTLSSNSAFSYKKLNSYYSVTGVKK